jgi:hypothetical protein
MMPTPSPSDRDCDLSQRVERLLYGTRSPDRATGLLTLTAFSAPKVNLTAAGTAMRSVAESDGVSDSEPQGVVWA